VGSDELGVWRYWKNCWADYGECVHVFLMGGSGGRVALVSALFPSREEGATGPSLLGTGDDSVPQFVPGGRVAQIPSVQEVVAPGASCKIQ
jgi:hypothetical protein